MKKYVIATIVALIALSVGLILFIVINPGQVIDQDFSAEEENVEDIQIVVPEIPVIVEEKEIRRIEAIAHRGMCGEAPQNTIPAFSRAMRAGADQIELDVQMTSDGVIVVFHDSNTLGITGKKGNIKDRTFAEVRALNAGYVWGDRYGDTKIPTLLEVLTLIKDSDMKVNLELKDIGANREFVENVLRIVRLSNMEDRIIFSSFRYQYLVWLKEIDDTLITELVSERGNARNLLTYVKADCYNLKFSSVTKTDIDDLHSKGKTVYLWTVDDEDKMMQALDMGADGVVTNNADIFISVRDGIY